MTKVRGGSGDDLLTSEGPAAFFEGNEGDDRLIGADEPDAFIGGEGADLIKGHGESDSVIYDYPETHGPVTVSIDGQANDGLGGEQDNVQVENVFTGAADDTIVGNQYANGLYGGGGRDRILGRAGSDTLSGDGGKDLLKGGSGDDSLHLGSPSRHFGLDRGLCGAGNDTVFHDQRDRVSHDCEQRFSQ